ncbi:unnamed protein product [Phaeothamnion confervicola]
MRSEFLLADGYKNFNHGSFGAVPSRVMAAKRALEDRAEARPDVWMRTDYYKYIDEARRLIAEHANADVADVVLVENASAAVNAVLRSLPWAAGDGILLLSTAYKMVRNVAQFLVDAHGVRIVEAKVPLPLGGPEDVLAALDAALDAAGTVTAGIRPETWAAADDGSAAAVRNPVRIAVVSHLTSNPAAVLPVAEIIRRCHARGIPVLVDGAHAVGQLPINLTALGAEYYVSNLHKWNFAPKTAAFLWVRRDRQEALAPEPNAISSTGRLDFVGRFAYTGTRDYTSFAAVPAAFAWRQWAGGDAAIVAYNTELAVWAGGRLAERWGTDLLVPLSMTANMVNIRLPTPSLSAATELQRRLAEDHDTYIVVAATGGGTNGSSNSRDGVVYCRLSAQVPRSFWLLLSVLAGWSASGGGLSGEGGFRGAGRLGAATARRDRWPKPGLGRRLSVRRLTYQTWL